jgi:4-diphosphocytidyl-2C-methyl-D-erythritol 2-phosphate synthase
MKDAILKSCAKVNLFLKVGKKLKNKKLHNIQSLTFLINLSDEILIKRTTNPKDQIEFSGEFKKYIHKNNNSIKKSLSLLRKKNFIDKKIKYNIKVKKNIPVFSGLGGGSSNAAAVIKYFFKGKKISKKNINYFSKYLGSDLRFFFKHNKMFQKKLSVIKEFKFKYKFYILLVYPFFQCSTLKIYSALDNFEFITNKNNYTKQSKIWTYQ